MVQQSPANLAIGNTLHSTTSSRTVHDPYAATIPVGAPTSISDRRRFTTFSPDIHRIRCPALWVLLWLHALTLIPSPNYLRRARPLHHHTCRLPRFRNQCFEANRNPWNVKSKMGCGSFLIVDIALSSDSIGKSFHQHHQQNLIFPPFYAVLSSVDS